MKTARPSAPLLLIALAAASPALASDAYVTEKTFNFSWGDGSGFKIGSVNTFLSIWETPFGDISDIFNEFMVIESVTPVDVGTTFTADLTSPAFAAPAARLTNGIDDDVWFGGDSDTGGSYDARRESFFFTGTLGPDGSVIGGPDLAGYIPTRAELTLNSLSLNFDGFETSVSGSVTVRFFAYPIIDTSTDISGAECWDLPGDPDNRIFTYDIAADLGYPSGTSLEIDSVAIDVVLTTIGASWASEARLGLDFDQDGSPEFDLIPGEGTDAPVFFQIYSSGGPIVLADAGIPNPISPNGLLTIEYFDTFDDNPDAVDAVFESPSVLTFTGMPVSVPCNPADLAEPFGVLDLADIGSFVSAFTTGMPAADLAPPFGVFDLGDITAFVNGFTMGCP